MKKNILITIGLLFFLMRVPSQAQQRILVLSWNVESDDNNPTVIARQLEDFEGYDIIGLSEVKAENAERYAAALAYGEGAYGKEPEFDYVLGTTGRADRLLIVWDNKRFEKMGETIELLDLKEGNHRAPLAVHLKLRQSSTEFLFMVNHLARGNEQARQNQATGLAAWAKQQSLPVIALGDYNFDYNVDDGLGNTAFDLFMSQNVFEWIRPEPFVKTSLHPLYNGILDFIFLAHKPSTWKVSSRILNADKTTPDTPETSDHRPVQGLIFIN